MMGNEALSEREQMGNIVSQTYALVQACPVGRVTTYGWIGKALGYPRGARMIGWIMNESPQGVPAHRVINSKGELSGSHAFGQIGRMRHLLEQEGIVFSSDGKVDLKCYGWDPSVDLSAEERREILSKANLMPAHASERLLRLVQTDPASPLRHPPEAAIDTLSPSDEQPRLF